ncbi:MAG: hypothetical protein JWP01_2413 [Myxococcales bacterium]|nr:hypothetical protein [Myxococcales bacterium]
MVGVVVVALATLLVNACKDTAAPPAVTTTTDVRVDRRVELVSILQRLTGHQAYTTAPMTPYVAAIDRTFGAFVDHPAVAATRALRASHSISWDAPIVLAVHLDDQLELVNPDELPSIDARFTGADVASYAAQLRAFAADTRLDAFLAAQRPYIEQVEARMRAIIDAENAVAWFDTFFGAKAKARYRVIPGLLAGHRNFGARARLPDGTLELYQVLGMTAADGLPAATTDSIALLVHEMAHSYINPVLHTQRAALEAPGSKLFALVEKQMRAQAYGDWTTLANESVVRALVVIYLRDRKGEVAALAELRAQEQLGFRWTTPLVTELRRYQAARTRYASFDAFVPELVATFERLAAQP